MEFFDFRPVIGKKPWFLGYLGYFQISQNPQKPQKWTFFDRYSPKITRKASETSLFHVYNRLDKQRMYLTIKTH